MAGYFTEKCCCPCCGEHPHPDLLVYERQMWGIGVSPFLVMAEPEPFDFGEKERQLDQIESREQMLDRLCRTTRLKARQRKGAPVFVDREVPEATPAHKPVIGAQTAPMGMRHKRWHFTRYARA